MALQNTNKVIPLIPALLPGAVPVAGTVLVPGTTTYPLKNENCAGVRLIGNISNNSGNTGTVTATLGEIDPLTGTFVAIPGAATTALAVTGEFMLTVHPAITAVANLAVSQGVGRNIAVQITIAGANCTLTLSAVTLL